MSKVVFAGPSVHGVDLTPFAALDMHPPAAAGDLLAAAQQGATAIGLIDGYFDAQPRVWHKEILAALAAGIPVLGAASMGALRAAECADYGMQGVGRIFADYHSGGRVADADVAVQHAPAELGYRPLTVAMVDVEATLEHHPPGIARPVLEAAQAIPFRERTWAKIAHAADFDPETAAQLAQSEVSQKRQDAQALLEELSALPTDARPVWEARKERFSRTDLFAAMERRVARQKKR